MMKSVMPLNWLKVNISEVCDKVTDGSHNPPKVSAEGLPMLSAKNINSGRVFFDKSHRLIDEESFERENSRTKICVNDVLLTVVGTLGRVAIVTENLPRFTLQRSVAVLSAKNLESQFFRYVVESPGFQTQIFENAKGTAQKGIYLKKLRELEFNLPPLAEQKQIATKLDQLLSQVNTLKNRLDNIPTILKRFRQSVLAAAVSGKLTEEWRIENKVKFPVGKNILEDIKNKRKQVWEDAELKKIKAKGEIPKNDKWKEKYRNTNALNKEKLDEIPDDWVWVNWEDILELNGAPFKRGPFGSSLKKSMFVDKGYKVYEQYCPINDDCSFARYFITKDKFKELEAFSVKSKDFLISCSGVTLGRITQIPDDYDEGVINQAILRVRLNRNVYSDDFFIKLFRSEYFQKKIFDNSTGSAIPNVKGVKELKSIPVPLMSIDEQSEIVRLVEQFFIFVDQIEKQVNSAQSRVNNLTQSILAKAFRGELTAEWREQNSDLISGENSAETLLEKIKTERQSIQKNKPKRTAKKKNSKLKQSA